MKTFYRITALLLLCGVTLAQSNCTRKDDIATQNFNGFSKIIPNALVTVCGSTATGQPCTPVATIYSDNACSVVVGSVTADINGNFHFYADPTNKYKYQISGSGVSTFEIGDVTLPLQSNSGVTLTKAISSSSYNNELQVATGADIGVTIAACNTAAIAGSGGTCNARALIGPQTCTTNFTLGAAGKPVKLIVPEGAQWSGACQATIAGSESGIEWEGNVPSYDFDQPTTAPWTYTATTGCGITVSAGARGAFVRNLLFRGANTTGTGNGLCATGDSSNSTAITGLDLSGSDFDEFPQDGIHLVGSVYGLNWVKTRATRNHRYGLAALYDGSNAANVFNQAQLFGFNATGNYSAQEHFESAGGSVDFMQIGGTVADTNAVCTTDCNGIEIVTAAGTGSSKAIIQGVHFESIGGSVDTPSPDTVNAEIYINTQTGADVISGNFFVNGGPHTHNAITLGSAATCKTLQIGPGDAATGQYATTFFDSTLPAGGGCGRTTIAENVGAYPASAFATGNITTNYVGGQFYRDDGTNFLFRNSAGTTVASVANATGAASFTGVTATGTSLVTLASTTVGALPSAASNSFAQIGVTDSTAVAAEGQTCVGGSNNKAITVSNGTVWKCF